MGLGLAPWAKYVGLWRGHATTNREGKEIAAHRAAAGAAAWRYRWWQSVYGSVVGELERGRQTCRHQRRPARWPALGQEQRGWEKGQHRTRIGLATYLHLLHRLKALGLVKPINRRQAPVSKLGQMRGAAASAEDGLVGGRHRPTTTDVDSCAVAVVIHAWKGGGAEDGVNENHPPSQR